MACQSLDVRLDFIMKPVKKTNGRGRTRNYATVVYPESAPKNWINLLSDLVVPCFVSPIHDRDVNPDGTVKKAHYHVMLDYEGPKSLEQAQDVFDVIGGVGIEKVHSKRGYARYLCHLDNPDKEQYSVEDVITFGGADYQDAISLVNDKYKAISEIIDFVDENNMLYYSQLVRYAKTNRPDWFRILCDSGTYVVKEYMKTRGYEYEPK